MISQKQNVQNSAKNAFLLIALQADVFAQSYSRTYLAHHELESVIIISLLLCLTGNLIVVMCKLSIARRDYHFFQHLVFFAICAWLQGSGCEVIDCQRVTPFHFLLHTQLI